MHFIIIINKIIGLNLFQFKLQKRNGAHGCWLGCGHRGGDFRWGGQTNNTSCDQSNQRWQYPAFYRTLSQRSNRKYGPRLITDYQIKIGVMQVTVFIINLCFVNSRAVFLLVTVKFIFEAATLYMITLQQ